MLIKLITSFAALFITVTLVTLGSCDPSLTPKQSKSD